ncbi:linoleate 9S-lipoxygenase 1-like [Herrania umbratica]|uniref:Linoleate 9S-lipoxygenase 1-like n=1 Tax=Herrania umbratica TaxID=108875 RepID=A0A6J0ZGP5_9ROSI|nr:linoleate 9S-lipoxygenase 1-like [Herrania umbratica]
MAETTCCGLRTCCYRPDPENDIIEGTFEIDHSPRICLLPTQRSVAIQIYSSDKVDPHTRIGLESKKAHLQKWKINRKPSIIQYKLNFEVVRGFGSPGAFAVENRGRHEFFLKSATFKYNSPVPDGEEEDFFFRCASWVYPLDKTGVKRIFFINQLYLPDRTPPGLVALRKKELKKLRGRGLKDERQPWDRIYEYDCYNDLGDPDNSPEYARPILGGSKEYPYPRRLRTGRPLSQHDHMTESRPVGCFRTFVPPDERLSPKKQEQLRDNFVNALVRFLTPKSDQPPQSYQECPNLIQKILHFFVPKSAFSTADFSMIQSIVDFVLRKPKPPSHQDTQSLDSIDDIVAIFSDKQVKEMDKRVKQKLKKLVPAEIFNQVVDATTKRNVLNSQSPSIMAENQYDCFDDDEFGRQMLAGTNPVRIRSLKEFSPREDSLPESLKLIQEEKEEDDELFILEHDDYLLPFLSMINAKGVCAYATRTILLSRWNDKLTPIAIELRLPDSNMVLGRNDDRWDLAKAHVAANDAAHHQLVSHWLHTHAVIEPFIIATRRQLSVMHPIHWLLDPHFKDTLHINALARGIFLNAGGILERTLFTGEFSMRLSSHVYKQWRFDEQALPKDLEKRGMAEKAKEKVFEIKEKPAENTGEEDLAKKTENVAERDEGVAEIDENVAERHEGVAETDQNVADLDEGVAETDENVVERDEGVAETDQNVVELDENPATPDEKVTFPAGVKLLLEDYPYAKDGIEIWDAIETWVRAYCQIFYKSDRSVRNDEEIRDWWEEIRSVGHVDQEKGWYDLTTLDNLVRALTTLIWITSGMHAAVNFGQYAYAGWPPNRPMLLRKFIPKEGTQEYDDMLQDPEKFFVKMLPEKFEMEFVIAVMDLLSRHTSDEEFLGQRPPDNMWKENKHDYLSRRTSDDSCLDQRPPDQMRKENEEVNEKFEEFRERLRKIEGNILERNKRYNLSNRWGYAKIPYKLLYPDTSKTKGPSEEKEDICGRGIPNSISI